MKLRKRLPQGLFVLVLVLMFAAVPSQAVHAGTSFDDVATELMCQCGCRLTLPTCNMPECKIQKAMSEQINYLIDKGQSKDEIIKSFVANYGEEALAAPTKKGFNLSAWLIPFVAIAASLGFVYMILDQWVLRRGRGSTEEAVAAEDEVPAAELSAYQDWLQRELDAREGGA